MRETGTFSSPIEISFAPLKTRKNYASQHGITLFFPTQKCEGEEGGNCWRFALFLTAQELSPGKKSLEK